jgi:hypothetical protein
LFLEGGILFLKSKFFEFHHPAFITFQNKNIREN